MQPLLPVLNLDVSVLVVVRVVEIREMLVPGVEDLLGNGFGDLGLDDGYEIVAADMPQEPLRNQRGN